MGFPQDGSIYPVPVEEKMPSIPTTSVGSDLSITYRDGNFAIPNPNCKLYALARGNISGFLRQVALIIVHMQEKMVFKL
jgi:hypothetical protein